VVLCGSAHTPLVCQRVPFDSLRGLIGKVCVMGRGKILDQYKTLSPDDRRKFDQWLSGNAVIGSILAAGLVAMAVAGSNSGPSHDVELAGVERAAPDLVATRLLK
jgi:hypothetical protein